MSSKKPKKNFQWEKGSHLAPDDYDPLGGVRDVGFNKLADGIYADPARRKEARAKKLSRAPKIVDKGLIVEESASGLHEEFTPSEASRLIRKENRGFKGVLRFKKSSSSKKEPPKSQS